MSRGLIAKYLGKSSVCISVCIVVLAAGLLAVFFFHGTCSAQGESHGCAICGHPPEPPWHYPDCPYYDGGLDDDINDDRQPPPPKPILPDRTKQDREQQKINQACELNDQGLSYLNQKNYQKAVECFKKALALYNHKNIENNLKRAQEYLAEERHKQSLAEAEEKVNQMLDSLAEDLDADQPTTASADDLDFKEVGESRYSKGTESSAPVDLRFKDPDKPQEVDPAKQKTAQKGLKTKPVPSPVPVNRGWDDFPKMTEAEMILDALEYGKDNRKEGESDWETSIKYLENYLLVKRPSDSWQETKVKWALSYIEGMRAGSIMEAKQPGKEGLFNPNEKLNASLFGDSPRWVAKADKSDADLEKAEQDLMKWKDKRTEKILEVLKKEDTWEGRTAYLKERCGSVISKEDYLAYKSAHAYIEGYYAYYQKLKEFEHKEE
jgi:tetratricopeptide (TPR) repeat protein